MTGLAATLAFAGYRLAGFTLIPVLPLALSRRAARGKEVRERLGERHGRASASRPPGPLVWIHAASVGETNSVMPLIDRIVAAGYSVVFTSVTITSAKIAGERLPKGAVHQFSPIDITPWIRRFLRHWRPDAALFVESEIWPVTIMELAAAGIPQILINARLSAKSFLGWQRLGSVARSLFGKISLCLAQSARDAERFRTLGVPDVIEPGNLKFDAAAPAADAAALAAFRDTIRGRSVWLAASTHEGEEERVAAAHSVLKKSHPGLLTIIVPRHPPRGAEVRAILAARGLTVAQRSIAEPIQPNTDVYLADTLGELGLFYRAAPIALVGASLLAHGGHNPVEPARLDCAILHGPYVANFEDIYAALDRDGGALKVGDAASLAKAVDTLLGDHAEIDRLAEGAVKAVDSFSGGLDRTMQALAPFIHAPAKPSDRLVAAVPP